MNIEEVIGELENPCHSDNYRKEVERLALESIKAWRKVIDEINRTYGNKSICAKIIKANLPEGLHI